MPIHSFSEDTSFQFSDQAPTSVWIERIINQEKRVTGDLNFIFCSDTHLHQMNLTYLNHDNLTDIITFDNSDTVEHISGDVFISVDRVIENAAGLSTDFEQELNRVIIHGILHLIGYNDKSPEEKARMREKEDACLSLR